MEKYGTYVIYKNRLTGKKIELPITDQEELQKTASSSEWELYEEEDNVQAETDGDKEG